MKDESGSPEPELHPSSFILHPSPSSFRLHPSRRVLVVDDNVDAAETMADLLGLWGHEARVVHDGASAVIEAAAFQPDVVFLDINMPGMDGYAVARELRTRPELAGLRLVAVTGYGQDRDRRRASEAGFDHHLTKPVDIADLKQLVSGAGRSSP